MELTKENKNYIDSMGYEALLQQWRFAPSDNLWFQGETGEYWGKRMSELKNKNPSEAVKASKKIGW